MAKGKFFNHLERANGLHVRCGKKKRKFTRESLKPICAILNPSDTVGIPVSPNHGMIFIVTIIAAAWLSMALFMVCALVSAAQRPAGCSQEEALAGMKAA